MDRINGLGESVNILWLNGDIILNGANVPSVNIFDDVTGKDLIVIKSNNLSEIYTTLLQYFYEKVILPDRTKTITLGRKLREYITTALTRNPSDESLINLRNRLRPDNLIKLLLYDQDLGRVLDSVEMLNNRTARDEVRDLLADLTSNITSKKVKKTSRYQMDSTSSNIEEHFDVTSDPTGIFRVRTIENAAWSDITIALAENFNTDGEKLTANSAGEKLISADLHMSVDEIVDNLWQQIIEKGLPQQQVNLNIAGNGIKHLSGTQEQYDDIVLQVISKLRDKGLDIKEIRSGGQSGIDEAGTKAAITLNIPWSVLAPENWKVILKNKITTGKQKFIERFDRNYRSDITLINGVTDNEDGTITIENKQTGSTISTKKYKTEIAKSLQLTVTQRLFKDNVSFETTPIDAIMFKSYQGRQRPDVKSKTTFEAIINGERTSTTRWKPDTLHFWNSIPLKSIVRFRSLPEADDPNNEYVYVRIKSRREITKSDLNDDFIKEWSEAEGWSKKYFEEEIRPIIERGGTVLWIQYELEDPRYKTSKAVIKRRQIISDAEKLADYILGTRSTEGIDPSVFLDEFLNQC